MRNKISYNIISPYENKITIDYDISYFGFNSDRKSTKKNLNCFSPLRDFEVKIDRFQIKWKVVCLKWTLESLSNLDSFPVILLRLDFTDSTKIHAYIHRMRRVRRREGDYLGEGRGRNLCKIASNFLPQQDRRCNFFTARQKSSFMSFKSYWGYLLYKSELYITSHIAFLFYPSLDFICFRRIFRIVFEKELHRLE